MNIRETIIKEAEAIILQKGFNTFRYKDISEKTYIKKADIHSHFSTKEDLAKAVIQKSRIAFRAWDKETAMNHLNAIDKLDAFFASYRSLLLDGDKICLAGILGAELNTLSPVIQNELRFYYLERQKWLEQTLSDGLYGGGFFFTSSVEEEALFILSSLQGGLQIARVNEDRDIFFTICRQLKFHLVKKQDAVMFKELDVRG